MSLDVRCTPAGLDVRASPYPRAKRETFFSWPRVTELCVGWAPPALRVDTGEFLFVSATEALPLAAYVEAAGIPFVSRVDVWSFILDEFLDTEFTAEQQARTLRSLEEQGVSKATVERLRAYVGPAMLRRTAITWEWVYYGLFDVLEVMSGDRAFPQFFDEAMELAGRGLVSPSSRAAFEKLYRRD